MTRAIATRVRPVTTGSVLVSDLNVGDLVLEVANGAPFTGKTAVTVAGIELAVTGVLFADVDDDAVTVDTVVLAAEAPLGAPADTTRVLAVPIEIVHQADVLIEPARTPDRADVPPHLADDLALKVASSGLDTLVELRVADGGGWVVDRVIGKQPQRDGRAIATGTLDLADATDVDAAAAKNAISMLARIASWFGVRLDNPIITGRNADGDGMTWDGPGAKLSFTQDGEEQTFFSALLTRLGGRVDADQFGADEAAIHLLLSLAPGAWLQLRSQLKPPAPPAVGTKWPSLVLDAGMPAFDQPITPLAFHDGQFWLFGLVTRRNVEGYQLQAWTFSVDWDELTTTGPTLAWEQPLGAQTLNRGVARIGPSWYFLVHPVAAGSSNAVQVRGDDGTLIDQWTVPAATGQVVGLGTDDSGNVLIAWDRSSSWDVKGYATTGGAPLSSVNCADGGGGIALFVGQDTYDLPSTEIVLGSNGDGTFVYATTGGSQVLADEWDDPVWTEHSQRSLRGIAFNTDDDYWLHLSNDGKAFRITDLERQLGYGDPVWRPAGIEAVRFLVTLRDASGHETEFDSTKVTTVDVRAGQQLVVTAGAVPTSAGADRYALYAATAGTARTDFHLIGTAAAGDNQWTLEELVLSGANPPAENSFPSGTSALVTADGVEQIRSDGTGHIYDLIAAGGGGGGGGIGGVGGGEWGDVYESFGVHGGSW